MQAQPAHAQEVNTPSNLLSTGARPPHLWDLSSERLPVLPPDLLHELHALSTARVIQLRTNVLQAKAHTAYQDVNATIIWVTRWSRIFEVLSRKTHAEHLHMLRYIALMHIVDASCPQGQPILRLHHTMATVFSAPPSPLPCAPSSFPCCYPHHCPPCQLTSVCSFHSAFLKPATCPRGSGCVAEPIT